jgi:hypothetical protein
MAKLTAKQRNAIPTKDFALKGRREPLNNKSHAEAALTMGMRKKTPTEKAEIRAAVHRKYPDLGKDKDMKKTSKETSKKATAKKGLTKKEGKSGSHKAITAQKGYTH